MQTGSLVMRDYSCKNMFYTDPQTLGGGAVSGCLSFRDKKSKTQKM
jgi:hypothetical protein